MVWATPKWYSLSLKVSSLRTSPYPGPVFQGFRKLDSNAPEADGCSHREQERGEEKRKRNGIVVLAAGKISYFF